MRKLNDEKKLNIYIYFKRFIHQFKIYLNILFTNTFDQCERSIMNCAFTLNQFLI